MNGPAWWNRAIGDVEKAHCDEPANLPGAVFGAETVADGALIASVGEGWSADTICEIGTMSKAFAATGVLLALEEHGRLDIETPVWRLPGMTAYARDETKRGIRVRHLLQHTSGLPTVQHYTDSPASPCNDPYGPAPYVPDAGTELGPTSEWTCYPGGTNEYVWVDGRARPARTVSLAQASRHFMTHYSPTTPPGEQYRYAPINYVIAPHIAEELTGQSINVFLKERLFEPLGMRDSFFVADSPVGAGIDEGVTAGQRERIADITLITRDGTYPPEIAPGPGGRWDKLRRGWRFVFPDGGMYTTVSDLLTFLRVLRDGGRLDGRRVLSEQIVRLLTDDQGFGHTMGFGYRKAATPYGQRPDTIEQLGSKMTYCWFERDDVDPFVGVFLSQRWPNIAVNPNMSAGLKVIFRVFVPAVSGARR